MASYHFTVKKDKSPSGKRIQGVKHVDYINRENEYDEWDKKRAEKHFGENFIHGLERKNLLDDEEAALLYDSPYGKIETNRKGLQVSDAPSAETIAIALMISKRAMGDTVVVDGSDRFKAKCISAALLAELDIKFADEGMQKIYEKKLEEHRDERERYRRSGGKLRRRSSLPEPDPDESVHPGLKAPTLKSASSLSDLSKRHLDGAGQEDASMLVSDHAGDELDNEGAGGSPPVRWDVRWGRRRVAVKTAKGILLNVLKHKKELSAMSHAKYIDREGAFKKRGGCVYKGCKLPSWAKDADGNPSPRVFFAAADRFTEGGKARYKEIEFSLPNELTLEQDKALIQDFIDTNLPDHYYAFAIHEKIGVLSNGTTNMHVHLMVSPKLIDDVEQWKERPKSVYFGKKLRSNAKDQSLENRRKHGAPNDEDFHDPWFLQQIRASFGEIQNKHLKEAGFSVRVDHRSLKAQREAALQEGDDFLAKLLDRLPEEHIRSLAIMEEGNMEADALRRLRAQKKDYLDILYAAQMQEQEQMERHIQKTEEDAGGSAELLRNCSAFDDADDGEGTLIHDLKEDFIQALLEVDKLKEAGVTFTKDATNTAIREQLSPKERIRWDEYHRLQREVADWNSFLHRYKLPSEATAAQRGIEKQMRIYIEDELASRKKRLAQLKVTVDAMTKRLMQNRDSNAKIKQRIQRILFETKKERNAYLKANERLKQATEALQDALFDEQIRDDKQASYSAKQLYAIMKKKYYGWQKEYKKLLAQCEKAKKAVLSAERVEQMAENIYTGGAEKELRELNRDIRDWEKYLKNDRAKATELETAFQKLAKPDPWDADALNAYNLKGQEVAEARKKAEASEEKLRGLQQRAAELEKKIDDLLQRPDATEKIRKIADGILKKNQPKVEAYHALVKKMEIAKQKMNRAKEQMNAAKKLASKESPKARYKKVRGGGGVSADSGGGGGGGPAPMDYKNASDIMDAILGDPKLVASVARAKEERNNGLDDWKLLSEVAKADKEMEAFLREVFG